MSIHHWSIHPSLCLSDHYCYCFVNIEKSTAKSSILFPSGKMMLLLWSLIWDIFNTWLNCILLNWLIFIELSIVSWPRDHMACIMSPCFTSLFQKLTSLTHLKEGCGKNALYLILSKKQKFVFERKNFHERNSVANSRHAFYKFKDLSCVTVPSRGQQVSYCLLKLPWRFVYMGQKKVRPDKPYAQAEIFKILSILLSTSPAWDFQSTQYILNKIYT